VSDRRLSPREAAEYIEREWYLRVHPDTVRRWAKGNLPADRDERGRLLIDADDLHAVFDYKRENATKAHESNDCNVRNS
jgi:hypothetical protein